MHDLIDSENSLSIGPLQWDVSDLELDSKGQCLVVISTDGMYINVYSTLKLNGEALPPIHKYCRGSSPCSLTMPLKVVNV